MAARSWGPAASARPARNGTAGAVAGYTVCWCQMFPEELVERFRTALRVVGGEVIDQPGDVARRAVGVLELVPPDVVEPPSMAVVLPACSGTTATRAAGRPASPGSTSSSVSENIQWCPAKSSASYWRSPYSKLARLGHDPSALRRVRARSARRRPRSSRAPSASPSPGARRAAARGGRRRGCTAPCSPTWSCGPWSSPDQLPARRSRTPHASQATASRTSG